MTYRGYLQKTQEGWVVLSTLRNEAIPLYDYIDPNLLFYNGRQVEFEVLQIDDCFAKLVWQKRDKPHVDKLAEEVYCKGVKEDYEEGFVDGYNKAKETLYSEIEVLQVLLRLQQTESYDNLSEWFEQFKKK